MKKALIWLVASLLFTMVGCVEGLHESGITETSSEQLPDLTAGFVEGKTKTYVESGKYLRWHEDDRLTAFLGNTLNRQYKFNGATGDNSGSFSYISSGNLETGNALDRIYAVYPYDETTTITDEGQISLTLPAVQTYAENSFGRGANTMLAVTENVEDTFLGFKNACGYLKLKLYNPEGATIRSVEVKGNGDEKIAGAATATIAHGEVPQLTMADDATTTITLDCGDGVALGTTAEAATEFWVVIPETIFKGGITITVRDAEGGTFEKSTTKEIVVERNAVQPMAALGVEFIAPVAKPANNEIWYTATRKVDPYISDSFDANVVSNEWDSATGEGVITFDGEVTSIGESAFVNEGFLTSITIPDSVTEIGSYAFRECRALTSIVIPNSVSTIDIWAFYCCTSLTSITIPDNITSISLGTFSHCTSLTSVTIPNSVTSIGNYAFSYCTSLTSITIPDGITEIGENTFEKCRSLTSITVPDRVTSIGKGAFSYCERLTSVTIGNSVTTIGHSAFYDCISLTSITIPNSVTTIDHLAFQFCKSLTSVTIGDGVTSIGSRVFNDCKSLTYVYCKTTTPPSLGTTYNGFDGNAPDRKIYVPMESVDAYKSAHHWNEYAYAIIGYDFETGEVVNPTPKPAYDEIWYTNGSSIDPITTYNTTAFGANIISNTYDAENECWIIKFDGNVTTIGQKAFYDCKSLTSITIPDCVTTIERYAFSGCTSLQEFNGKFASVDGRCLIIDGVLSSFAPAGITEYTIPDYVTIIEYDTFKNCEKLTRVTIPDSVTTIRDYAFYGCTSLTSITIGNSVTTIGECALYDCISLVSVTIGVGLTRIGYGAFRNCKSLTSITIPDSVTTIDNTAFYNCENLTNVTIPDSVTTIGSLAFELCDNLTSVTIGNNVTTIGHGAFNNCTSLTSVYCKAVTPPSLDGYWTFGGNTSGRKIYVPMESVDAYKSAEGWTDYVNAIIAYDFENNVVVE